MFVNVRCLVLYIIGRVDSSRTRKQRELFKRYVTVSIVLCCNDHGLPSHPTSAYVRGFDPKKCLCKPVTVTPRQAICVKRNAEAHSCCKLPWKSKK